MQGIVIYAAAQPMHHGLSAVALFPGMTPWLPINAVTAAVLFLLAVLIVATRWGLLCSLLASVVATACLTFFFLPPLQNLRVAGKENWLALLTFALSAVVASRLSERSRDAARRARHANRQMGILLSLSRDLLRMSQLDSLLQTLPATVARATGARSSMMYVLDGDRVFQAGDSNGTEVEVPHLHRLAESLEGACIELDEVQIPVSNGSTPRGLLVVRGADLTKSTAEEIGKIIASAMERGHAA